MALVTGRVRLSELLASLSLATDLGTGQPLGHGLRTCLISVAIAEELGCGPDTRRRVHQVSLLRFLGCTSDAAESAAAVGGDEIGFNRAMSPVLHGAMSEATGVMLGAIAPGQPWPRRARLTVRMLADPGGVQRSLSAHCEVAAMLARRLFLHPSVVTALEHGYERWDGRGHPGGLAGDDVPVEIRICTVARDIDLFLHSGRDPGDLLARRRGKAYDPDVVDAYRQIRDSRWEADWGEVMAREPKPVTFVEDLVPVLRVIADFTDLKSPWTRGHSPMVADLARRAGERAGWPVDRCEELWQAGLVHDIGRVGVPNGVWDKPGPLSTAEWEQVQTHPYLTQRVLARCPALARIADVATSHHERLDGSGYHRAMSSEHLAPAGRFLAAADVMAALVSPRPHRAAMRPEEASTVLDEEARSGRLDPEAVSQVVAAAGGEAKVKRVNPGGLSDREVEVLRLLATGLTNRQVGEQLYISPKTVGRHVENIYAKIGLTTRAGAALYAMEHRLLG